MTDVAGAEEIKDSMLDCLASPTSKVFRECGLRRLMSLALPVTTEVNNIVVLVQWRAYIQTAENDLRKCITSADSGHRRVFS